MNSKHRKTLTAIFADPVSPAIAWEDIEASFRALGAELSEGRGSRVRMELGGRFSVFHRPHPQTVTDRGAVRSVRRFLTNAGVKP